MTDATAQPAPTGDGAPTRTPLPRRFLVVWAGQTVSLVGTDVVATGVAMIAFLRTGSVTWLSVLYLAGRVPALLVASHAGALVDRTDHRRVLLAADAVAGTATLLALGMHLAGVLELWHLVVLAVVGSLANAYQHPAYSASVPLLAGRDQLPRAHGLLQLGPAVGLLTGPALAGVLVAVAGVPGILLADLLTFLVAVATTAAVRFPPVPAEQRATGEEPRGSLRATWRHLDGRLRGVRRIVCYGAALNLVLTAVNVLLLALLLTVTTEERAGFVVAAGGVAMVVASLVTSARGVPQRRVRAMAVAIAITGAGIVLTGLRPSLPLVVLGLVVTLGAVPVLNAAVGVVRQTQVDEAWQGRLAAFGRVLSESLVPVAVLLVAPVVELVAEPAMQPGGAAAGLLGGLLGTGEGRGIGLVFVATGLAVVVIGAVLSRDRWVAALEQPHPAGVDAAPRPAGGPVDAVPVPGAPA